MTELRTAHTADLDIPARAAARALLEDVFDGDIDDHDWEHSLGGVHALVWEGAELIGHASLFSAGCCTAGGRCGRATSRAWEYARTTAGTGTAPP